MWLPQKIKSHRADTEAEQCPYPQHPTQSPKWEVPEETFIEWTSCMMNYWWAVAETLALEKWKERMVPTWHWIPGQ